MCVFHDNENLFMHAYYFSNFISKYLKCAVKIYFLALPVDCFLLCREKNKDHQSSSTPHGDVHPFSCLSFSDLHQTQTYIAFFIYLDQTLSFSAYYLKTDGSFLYPNYSGCVMDMGKMMMVAKTEVIKMTVFVVYLKA